MYQLGNYIKNLSNKIIKENYKNLFVLSNDWLFYKRFHTVELEKYKILKNNFLIFLVIYFFLLIKNLLKNFIKLIFSIRYYFCFQKISNSNTDVVFVSYKFNSNYSLSNDSYFSNVYKELKKKKKNFFIIAVNHNKNFLDNKNKIQNYYELNKNSNLTIEIYINFVTTFYCLKYLVLGILKKNNFERKFFLLFSLSFLYGNTIDNLKYYFQIKKIILKTRPKSIVSIFEGHALERLIFRAAKKIDNNIKTIAYNHSIVTSGHNAIFLDLRDSSDPEKFIFANQISKNIFSQNKIKNKNLFCVSRDSIWRKSFIKIKNNYCLVAPEGLDSENIKMFQFTLDYLKKYRDLKFIWRFHPIYFGREKKFIKKNLKEYFMFKKRILLSSRKINKDFKISKFVLYRGSTVVIESLKNNLIPINLDFKNNDKNNFLMDSKYHSYLKVSRISDLNYINNNPKIYKKIFQYKNNILNNYSIINNNIKINYFL